MTDLKYDRELPFAVIVRGGEKNGTVLGRFIDLFSAEQFRKAGEVFREIVDTTPKPKIPEDAEFIIWDDGSYLPQIAQRDSGPANLGWRYGAEEDYRWYSSESLSREIGDAEVTVLVRKDET